MNEGKEYLFFNPKPYVPASLSELHDWLLTMIGGAPTFVDDRGIYPERSLDTEFACLTEGFGIVRKKLGEDRYAAAIDLAARAKALFAADPDEDNGKTMEGIGLIYEMMDVVQSTRKRRVATKQADDEGEVTGD